MAQLAIKGHPTRGKEVLQLLEMLGGENSCNLKGVETDSFYYICKDNDIYLCLSTNTENFIVFTLEEFEEKFPYKVGDDVLAYAEGCLAKFTIQDIRWNYELNKVEYKICSSWLDASLMQSYKEETMEERDEKPVNHVFDTDVISFDIAQKDKYELDLQGKFEVVLREGKYYVERIKPTYPKDYEECCKVLGYEPDEDEINCYQGHLIESFVKLLICRDAYRKIAGEQMGLGKPWEPDWNNYENIKYIVGGYDGEIGYDQNLHIHKILAFPTEEMRDVFYENFKELINECKELL